MAGFSQPLAGLTRSLEGVGRGLTGALTGKQRLPSGQELLAELTSLSWAINPLTNRQWAGPLSAVAIGMGLFIGVAIGPGIDATLGTAANAVQSASADNAGGTENGGLESPTPSLGSPVGNAPPRGPSAPAPSPVTATVAPPVVAAPAPAPATTTPATTTPNDTGTTPNDDTGDDTTDDVVFSGTVIHLNPEATSYVVTNGGGQMNAVHTKKNALPKIGEKIAVPVRELANGTYAEDGKRTKSGTRSSVKLGGLVTFADAASGEYTVSRRGASLLVHAATPAAGAPFSVPEVASLVTVEAKLSDVKADTGTPVVADPPASDPSTAPPATTTTTSPVPAAPLPADCGAPPPPPDAPTSILTETGISVDTDFLGYSDFEGIVQGVCAAENELVLSADDVRESGQDITFTPGEDAGIDLSALAPGDVIDASAVIDENTAALELTGVSSDDQIKGADDVDLAQGDQATG